MDAAAKNAHSHPSIVKIFLDTTAFTKQARIKCSNAWDGKLRQQLQVTFLGQLRSDSRPQPWVRARSRILDVALTRLRIGHTRLASHLYRLHMVPDKKCRWCGGPEETLIHVLTICPRFYSKRTLIKASLHAHGINNLTLPILLGGIGLPDTLKPTPIRLLGAFLRSTGIIEAI